MAELTPAVVSLLDGRLLAPGSHLSAAWRSFQIAELAPGERARLRAGDLEHLVYVLGGEGAALIGAREVDLAAGAALTVAHGSEVELRAGDASLRYFHVAIAVD